MIGGEEKATDARVKPNTKVDWFLELLRSRMGSLRLPVQKVQLS